MGDINSFGFVGLGSEGEVVLLPLGDVDLTDPEGEAEVPSSEAPVYNYRDVVDVFAQSGRHRLEVLRLAVERYIKLEQGASPKNLDELKRMLRDLCRDDLCGLPARRPMARLQFAVPGVVRSEAQRLLSGSTDPSERLSQWIALAGRPWMDPPGHEGDKLIRRRISHLMAGHREAVRPEHIQALLQLALRGRERYLRPILDAVGDWSVSSHVEVLGELIRGEDIPPLLELAGRGNREARAILLGLFGVWQGMLVGGDHPTFDLFTGDHLWGLFDLMKREPVAERSWGSVMHAVRGLAGYRPGIFGPEHVAWLETLAPFQDHEDDIHGTMNEYKRILERLRKERPDLFPKRGLLSGGGRKKYKNIAEAQLAAEEIRRRATQKPPADDEARRPGGGISTTW